MNRSGLREDDNIKGGIDKLPSKSSRICQSGAWKIIPLATSLLWD